MTLMEFKSKMEFKFTMIPKKLEEMGLKPLTHRVYSRIAYRAYGEASQGHFESQENMAKSIFISVRQIRRELKILEKCQMIQVTIGGKNKWGHFIPNLIEVLDLSEWIPVSSDMTDSHMGDIHHRTHSPAAIGLTVPPRADCVADITRPQKELDLNLTINAAVQQKPAAIKKEKRPTWKPSSKMKTWFEKTDDEKRDTILNMAVDAHDLAIEKRRAKYFPYNDVPDVLGPLLTEYGIDKSKEFFEWLKNENRGCDVRKLSKAMKQFACHANAIPAEQIRVQEPAENFPQEIIKQMDTNNMYIQTNPIKLDDVNVENFPIRLKKFYDSIKWRRERLSLKKEIALMGLENFLKMRATAIMRCSYEELFVENVPRQAFF